MTRIVAIAALLLAARTAAAQPQEFTMTVSPTGGSLTDEYVVTVVVRVAGVNDYERYFPPGLKEFTVLDSRKSTSTQWYYDASRGQQVMIEHIFKYVIRPSRAGKLRIEPAKVRLDKKDFETKALVVDVAADGAPPIATDTPTQAGAGPPAERAGEVLFLHAVTDKTRVWEGEQITVTWLLYTREGILKFVPAQPRLDGVLSLALEAPTRLRYEEAAVAGRPYNAAIVRKDAVFPTAPGKLAIPPLEGEVSTVHDPFGGARIASNPLEVEVQPLPDGAPAGFDPAWVGRYAITASIDRDAAPAGEPIFLTLTVKGLGALQRMRVPNLTLEDFTVYAPKDFEEDITRSGDVVGGERRYTYMLTPEKGGKQLIGPIEIPYFDPTSGKYAIARADAIPITVVGDPATATGAAGGVAEKVVSRDIRPEHAPPSTASRAASRFRASRWMWLAFAIPPMAFLLAIVGDRLRERLRRETPRARLRRARGRARKRMRVAELHIRGGRAGKFFGEVAGVLYDHLEERLGEPVRAMTRDQLRDHLTKKGFPEETVDALVRELENADFARFAPSASGPGEMRAALRRVRALLGAIERVRPVGVKEAA